jgi:hypothetical protein
MYEDSDHDYTAYDEMESNDEVYRHMQVQRRRRPSSPISSGDDSSSTNTNSTSLSYMSTAATATSPSSNSALNAIPISAICIKRRPGRPNKIGGRSRPRTKTHYEPLDAAGIEQRNSVRAALIRYNTTQTDLARYIGVCKASMCTWLQGVTSAAMHNKIWGGVNQWMQDQEEIANSRSSCTSCGMIVHSHTTLQNPNTQTPTTMCDTITSVPQRQPIEISLQCMQPSSSINTSSCSIQCHHHAPISSLPNCISSHPTHSHTILAMPTCSSHHPTHHQYQHHCHHHIQSTHLCAPLAKPVLSNETKSHQSTLGLPETPNSSHDSSQMLPSNSLKFE